MKKQDFKMTDYLVVKVSDHINEKYIGYKLIPAQWVEKPVRHPTAEQNYLIRYPEEESPETALQVKNKEPFNQRWPTYCALIQFANGSYENACKVFYFIKEDDEMDLPSSAGELPTNEVNSAEPSETPSTSKRRLPDENENNELPTTNDILPKKKRVSAIRSENQTKFLIDSGQLKQNVSPKKPLSLRKEDRAETLEKFNVINKLNYKEVTEEPHETLEIISSTDDSDTHSDNDGEPETLRPPKKSMLETVLRMPYPTITTKNNNSALKSGKTSEGSKTPSRETVATATRLISSTEHLEQHKEPKTNTDGSQSSLNVGISSHGDLIRNLTTKNHNSALQSGKTSEGSKTPSRETVATATRLISSTKHLEQHKEPKTNTDGSQSSLNVGILSHGDLKRNFAPKNSGNGSKADSAEDLKHLEEIYNSILSTKSNLNAVFVEKGEGLRKYFKSFNLVVPELKQGLSLPSIQQLRENRLVVNEEP